MDEILKTEDFSTLDEETDSFIVTEVYYEYPDLWGDLRVYAYLFHDIRLAFYERNITIGCHRRLWTHRKLTPEQIDQEIARIKDSCLQEIMASIPDLLQLYEAPLPVAYATATIADQLKEHSRLVKAAMVKWVAHLDQDQALLDRAIALYTPAVAEAALVYRAENVAAAAVAIALHQSGSPLGLRGIARRLGLSRARLRGWIESLFPDQITPDFGEDQPIDRASPTVEETLLFDPPSQRDSVPDRQILSSTDHRQQTLAGLETFRNMLPKAPDFTAQCVAAYDTAGDRVLQFPPMIVAAAVWLLAMQADHRRANAAFVETQLNLPQEQIRNCAAILFGRTVFATAVRAPDHFASNLAKDLKAFVEEARHALATGSKPPPFPAVFAVRVDLQELTPDSLNSKTPQELLLLTDRVCADLNAIAMRMELDLSDQLQRKAITPQQYDRQYADCQDQIAEIIAAVGLIKTVYNRKMGISEGSEASEESEEPASFATMASPAAGVFPWEVLGNFHRDLERSLEGMKEDPPDPLRDRISYTLAQLEATMTKLKAIPAISYAAVNKSKKIAPIFSHHRSSLSPKSTTTTGSTPNQNAPQITGTWPVVLTRVVQQSTSFLLTLEYDSHAYLLTLPHAAFRALSPAAAELLRKTPQSLILANFRKDQSRMFYTPHARIYPP
jgi:hypothetical protein